ncbi:MAG: hypothetical protein ABGZ35_23165 [Planctomycetaceae bacterium]
MESNGREGRERAVPACPAQEITSQFNSTFGMKCQLTRKRHGQLRARWQDAWWRDNWRTALERAGPSRFLNGDNDRGWKIDLEFFLKPDTAAKILEGKYDNRAGTQPNGRPTTNQSIANLAAAAGLCQSPGSLVPDEATGHVQQGGSGLLGYDPRHVPD